MYTGLSRTYSRLLSFRIFILIGVRVKIGEKTWPLFRAMTLIHISARLNLAVINSSFTSDRLETNLPTNSVCVFFFNWIRFLAIWLLTLSYREFLWNFQHLSLHSKQSIELWREPSCNNYYFVSYYSFLYYFVSAPTIICQFFYIFSQLSMPHFMQQKLQQTYS